MQSLLQDVRFGVRVLRNSPGFAALAVVTLAIGIAANSTVFCWVDSLLLHPFAGSTDSGRLVILDILEGAPTGGSQISWLDYRDFRKSLTSFSGIALHREDVFNLGESTAIQPVWGELVSGNYFAVLGVRPALGRAFTREEDGEKLGAYPVVIISHALWQTRFRGAPDVIGKTMRVNRHDLTIVGVAPEKFYGTMPGMVFDLWIPVTMGPQLSMVDESMFRNRGYRNMYAIARLHAGSSIEQARAEASSTARNLAVAFPKTNKGVRATVVPLWKLRSAAPDLLLGPLRILMAVSVLVLLIVCANVANLLLARSVARQKEFGIRIALGASRFRLARQCLIESLLLAAGGAAIGIPVASWIGEWLPSLIPHVGIKVAVGYQLNGRILAFTILTCLAAALLSGAAPALFSARSDVNETLKEGGRSGTPRAQSHRTRGILVIAEIALAAVALIGAGLFGRSFRNARAIHPGFDRENVLLGRFYLSASGYSSADIRRFAPLVTERLRSAPGIRGIAYADFVPLGSTGGPWVDFQAEGYAPAEGEFMTVSRALISPGYFALLRIPLLHGRDFTDNDDQKAPPVAIVNQAFAGRYLRGAPPIGRKVRVGSTWCTVIGVARDIKYFSVAEAPRPYLYSPFRQRSGWGEQLYMFLRTDSAPERAAAALRRAVADVDPNAGAFYPIPLAQWTELTMIPQKIASSMLLGMGLVSLLLAAVGLYSVMAYSMTQRTHEIGIRMALGAMPSDVIRMALRQGIGLIVVGVSIGVTAALAASRVVSSMLVNVRGADPITFAAVPLFLGLIAILASVVPAWRAIRLDPMSALRAE